MTADEVYAVTLDGGCPEGGNVEAPLGWFALVDNYVVRQDNEGFIDLEEFDSDGAARERFEQLEAWHNEWEDQDA